VAFEFQKFVRKVSGCLRILETFGNVGPTRSVGTLEPPFEMSKEVHVLI